MPNPKPQTQPGQAKGRLIQLDFVRGLAILMVLAHHFFSWPLQIADPKAGGVLLRGFEWSGVDLFFVLSGFLVGGLLIREIYKTGSLKIVRFIKRRSMKLWPAYYVYLIFQFASHHLAASTYLVANLLHVQNYMGTSLQHTWSLAVQEHFYLLLPVFLIWVYAHPFRKANAPWIFVAICAVVLALRSYLVIALGTTATHVQVYTHTRIDGLLFGVMLAHLYQFHRHQFESFSRRRALLLSIILSGFLFQLVTDQRSSWMITIGYTLNYVCFGALLLLIIGINGRTTSTLPYRMIAWLGVYSYSIYLWHLSVRTPILHFVSRLPVNDRLKWIGLYAAQYACAITLGYLMTKLIEWPILLYRDRLVPA